MLSKSLISIITIILACSCTSERRAPDFDGNRAFDYLSEQVSFGPRVPGTDASKQCRNYIFQHFQKLGMTIDSQSFSFVDPYSKVDTPLVNLIARFKGEPDNSKGILLMAHYDSRPRADRDRIDSLKDIPISGANDGASGVAVLMELGNLLADKAPRVNVDIVLVDGEDWGKEGDIDYYLLGSSYFAKSSIREKYNFGIVVDMIGDKDQKIYREQFSERFYKPLNDMVWFAAKDLGISTFVDSVKHVVYDDHLPLGASGVPSIVLIDFLYPYWHTTGDTVDKCSVESLTNVGRLLTKIVYNKNLWPRI